MKMPCGGKTGDSPADDCYTLFLRLGLHGEMFCEDEFSESVRSLVR